MQGRRFLSNTEIALSKAVGEPTKFLKLVSNDVMSFNQLSGTISSRYNIDNIQCL